MPHSRTSFTLSILVALLAVGAPRLAAAQDMPPIFSAPDLPAATTTPAPANVTLASPSAQVAIPPAPVPAPVKKPQVAVAKHPMPLPHRHVATAAEKRKFAALMNQLASTHRETVRHQAVRRVAVHEPNLPRGTIVPPPGYYPPGPYERLVYGGPPRGPYGWGSYPRPYSYYGYP